MTDSQEKRLPNWIRYSSVILVPVVAVLFWHLIVTGFHVREVLLPGPVQVAAAFMKLRPELFSALLRTLAAAGIGLGFSTVIGVFTAFVFSQSAPIRQTFYPYAILLQTIPIIAIAPMVVIALGRSLLSVSLISAVLSLFPIITSTTTGLLQVDPRLLELFRLHRATRMQILLKLRLPHALPYLISGLRIASGAAIVGAIVGEFFVGSSRPGLGAMIQKKATGLNNAELYATVAVATSLGILMFAMITVVGEQLLKRRFGMSLKGPASET